VTDKALYLRLLGYLQPHRKRFIIGLLASIPAAVLNGALAFAIGPFIDKLMLHHNFGILLLLPVVILAASLMQGIFDFISTYCTSYVGTAISQAIRVQLYEHLGQMDWRYFQKNSQGELLSRYYSDPSRLQEVIVTNMQTFILEFFSLLALAAVLLVRSVSFTAISLVVISFIGIPIHFISKKLRRLDHENQQIMATIYDIFYESVAGFKVVNIFGLQRFQMKKFQKSLNHYFGNSMSLVRASALLKPLMQFIGAIGISLILLFGGMQVQSGQMSPGDLTSFLVALVLLYKPVKSIGTIISKVQRIFAPAERVFEKLDTPPAIQEAASPVELNHFDSLTFDNVSFAYDPNKLVLQHINFELKKGQTLALVGESGGGKSTLADLIPRFMDVTDGQILINGVDVRKTSMLSLRKLTAVVSQDTVLFHGTIRENIRLGRLDATDTDIERVVDLANLRPVIDELSDGLDTVIGYRGITLSGGQKQRVAIARALLKDSPLLIMDEATSALDNESEALVQDAMDLAMRNKTVIVIAHRLSTIRHADRILVLDKGKIAESGSHEELLSLNGIYSKLYYLQFRHDSEHIEQLKAIHENRKAWV